MVSASHKRKVPPTTGPDPKRSKKSANPATGKKTNLRDGNDAKSRRISKTRAARPAGRVVLDASSLGWEAVGDDFGALQVLSGVDVVKDGEKVQFIVKDDDATPTARVAAESAAEGEAFEGLGDDVLEASGRDSRAGGDAEARVAVGGTEEESLAAASKRTTVVGGGGDEYGDKEKAQEKKKKTKKNGGKGKGGKMVVEETKDDDDDDNDDDDTKMAGKAVKAVKADTASRKSKSCNQKKLSKSSSSQAKGNEFSALADMESDKAEDNDLDMAAWVALNLSPSLVSAIARLGFAKPTAIQQQSIPAIVAGEDVIGKAQTGSGKTLAFGIPIVERWLDLHEGHMDVDVDVDVDVDMDVHDDEDEGQDQNPSRTTSTTTKIQDKNGGKPKKAPLAVILSPTRELAKQIGDHIKAVCEGLPTSSPYVCVVTGGLSIQKQQRQLEKADIVIGTPGRLWEVLDGDASLQEQFTKIQFLVIDEADRLFKVGQFKEAENIIGALDRQAPEQAYSDDSDSDSDPDPSARALGKETRERQTLVFSATFDKDLQTKLAGKAKSSKSGDAAGAGEDDKMAYLMKCLKFRGEPTFIDVNPVGRMADNLREGLIECGAMEKDLYLYTILLLNPGRRTLVFTNSISAVRRITPLLQNLNQNALPLHSQMIQKARLRSLEKFAASRNSILVATDVAARGLDIKDVDQVVHYHVPRAADTYIHRSGRTARADRSGVSIILCSPDEVLPTRRLAGKVHAQRSGSSSGSDGGPNRRPHMIESLPVDRKIASRLRPRLDLAKKITDAALAKEKAHSNDAWLRNAAEELGVEYDSEEFEATEASGWAGGSRGGGRRRKEKEAKALTKAEMGALKAQLRHELSQRVNLGVSEKYITGGRVDVAQLLKQRDESAGGIFLGGENLGLGL
ncbi:ATP-dependent RNA helicase [Claviceps pusilla]|uniref:RNA helicase n=1 Tax=Claviceps pusilla TaxID=123648 RepID=A0A9P7NCL3_9HYPO|nr:ATP-dependent RNA helicase [Claviceps pusilla]